MEAEYLGQGRRREERRRASWRRLPCLGFWYSTGIQSFTEPIGEVLVESDSSLSVFGVGVRALLGPPPGGAAGGPGEISSEGRSWAAGVGSGTVGTQERQVYLLSFYGCDKCSARVAIGRSSTGDSGGAEPSLGGRGWSLADTQGCPFELYGGRRVGGGARRLLSLCRVAVLLETVALSGTAGFWDVFGGGLLLDPQPARQTQR